MDGRLFEYSEGTDSRILLPLAKIKEIFFMRESVEALESGVRLNMRAKRLEFRRISRMDTDRAQVVRQLDLGRAGDAGVLNGFSSKLRLFPFSM